MRAMVGLLLSVVALTAGAQTATDADELARRAEIRRRFDEAEAERARQADAQRQAQAWEQIRQAQEQAAAQAEAAAETQRRILMLQMMRPPAVTYQPIPAPPMIRPHRPASPQPFSCRTYRNLGGQLQTDCF